MMLEKIKLQKESPLPLYYQLKSIIKTEIENGGLIQGDLIPSERELVEVCQISRPTVRQAINELVAEGLLMREKGRGTFVSKPKVDQWFLESLLSFSKEMELKGMVPSTKVISLEVVKAEDPVLIDIFGEDCNELVCLKRVRYADGQPLVVVTSYIPLQIAPGLEKEDFSSASLYDLIENKYGNQISYVTRVLESINVHKEDVEWLQVDPKAAVQLIKTTAYLEGDRPFEYSIARYRGDNNSFTVTLKYRK
ncbi:GntR family transcriptional regulator [Cohnella terricola]|uniref:GntR family transcriptional regulator n=1 Tax=Cohnella terricola TaxID=1289167 RepID=A0A559J8N0_9BACL|nr:GntR family transcriptional regulator [Cohnella terricola]TVX96249.1 GntR family transcriptional regulator [Cohnella terricola]